MVLSPACVLLLSSQLLGCTAELGRAGDGPQSALSMAPDVSCLPLPICSLPSPPWLPGGPVISGFPSSLASGRFQQEIQGGKKGKLEYQVAAFSLWGHQGLLSGQPDISLGLAVSLLS